MTETMFRDWSGYSEEWDEWRELADIAYPPHGTEFDSWDDGHPSQRALLVQAMRETPDLLRWAIKGQTTWSGIVGRVIAGRYEMREQMRLEPEPESPDLTPSQSTYRLAEIFRIIEDSGT